jgi:hypothetical protein
MAKKKGKQVGKGRNNLGIFFVSLILVVLVVGISIFLLTYERPIGIERYELPAPPADAIEVDSCGALDQAGKYYLLNASISGASGSCFSIIAPDVVLDGNGFSVGGVGFGSGVQSNSANSLIFNLQVSDFETGIEFASGASNGTEISNTFVNNNEDVYDYYALVVQIATDKEVYYNGEDVRLVDNV